MRGRSFNENHQEARPSVARGWLINKKKAPHRHAFPRRSPSMAPCKSTGPPRALAKPEGTALKAATDRSFSPLLFRGLFRRSTAKKTRMRADADREDCTPAASPPSACVFPTRGAGTLEFRGRGGRALGFSSHGGTWNRASVLSARYAEFSSFINRGWGSPFDYVTRRLSSVV